MATFILGIFQNKMFSSVSCLFVWELKLLPRFHFLHPPLSPILIMLHFSPSRLCPPLSSSSLILPSFCPPPTLLINLAAPPRPTFAWHFRGCRSICGRRHQGSANCSCSACSPPPPSFHVFFFFFIPLRQSKKEAIVLGGVKEERGRFVSTKGGLRLVERDVAHGQPGAGRWGKRSADEYA